MLVRRLLYLNENNENYDSNEYLKLDNFKSKDVVTKTKQSVGLLTKLKQNDFFKKISSIKHFKALALLACFVVAVLLVISYDSTPTNAVVTASTSGVDYTSSKEYVTDLEQKLTSLIGSIKGAGQTKVMVTIESGPEIKVANTVEEKTTTTSSGTTVTVVTNPIIIEQNGEQIPLILMEVVPKVKGVIVVSEGASNAKVKLDIYTAIKALLDIPSGNIEIFSGI